MASRLHSMPYKLAECGVILKFPDWQTKYAAVLLEVDPLRFNQRMQEAEVAIFSRLQTLQSAPINNPELDAIMAAIHGLQELQATELGRGD